MTSTIKKTPEQLKPIKPISAGDLVVFSSGEYSSYSYMAVTRCEIDFTHEDLLKALEASEAYEETRGRYSGFDEAKFVAYLTTKGPFKALTCRELHLGDYGELAIEDFGNATE